MYRIHASFIPLPITRSRLSFRGTPIRRAQSIIRGLGAYQQARRCSRWERLVHPSEATLLFEPSVTDPEGRHEEALNHWYQQAQNAETTAGKREAYRMVHQLACGVDDEKAKTAWAWLQREKER